VLDNIFYTDRKGHRTKGAPAVTTCKVRRRRRRAGPWRSRHVWPATPHAVPCTRYCTRVGTPQTIRRPPGGGGGNVGSLPWPSAVRIKLITTTTREERREKISGNTIHTNPTATAAAVAVAPLLPKR